MTFSTTFRFATFHFSIYSSVMSTDINSLSMTMTKWELELGAVLNYKWWSEALHRINYSSPCVRLSLIHLKLTHRAYLCNAHLAEFYYVSPLCPCCSIGPAPLLHMFWSCSKLRRFCSAIFRSMSLCYVIIQYRLKLLSKYSCHSKLWLFEQGCSLGYHFS